MHCGVQAIVQREHAFMRDDMVKDSASPLVKPNVYLQGNYLMQSRSSKILGFTRVFLNPLVMHPTVLAKN